MRNFFLSYTFSGMIVYFRQNDRVVSSIAYFGRSYTAYFQSNDRIIEAMIAYVMCGPVNDVPLYISNIIFVILVY